MADSDNMQRKRSLGPQVVTILIVHFVFAFATFFFMYFFSLFFVESTAQTIGSVISIILFIMMLYVEGWRSGQQEVNLMNFGHIDHDKLRGLKAGIISQIPGLIFIILAIIFEMMNSSVTLFAIVFKFFYAPFVDIIWLMGQATPLLYVLLVVVTPAVYHIAYSFGYKGFSLRDRFVYKQKREVNREQKFR